ncbi:MAG: ABC transporter permease subunit [Longimicrobiales bacterium]
MRSERAMLVLAVAVVGAAGLAPMLAVLAESVRVGGQFGLAHYGVLVRSTRQWQLLGHSVLLASLVAGMATTIGLPLGVLMAKTDLPLRGTLAALFTFPFLLPPYVVAVGWFQVFGRGGIVGDWLGPAVAERTHAILFGLSGTALVLASCLMPVVMLLTMLFVRTVPPRLEEAARLAAPWGATFIRVTIPLILPGVLLGALIVFLLALGEFAVPMFLRYDVYSVDSFTRFAALYQPAVAAAASVPLGLIALLLVALERLFLRDRTYEIRFAASAPDVLTAPLGRARFVLLGVVLLLGAVGVALPLGSLAIRSAAPGVYPEAFARGWDALVRSLGYAAAGATLLTVIGFALGYLIQRRALSIWRAVDSLTILLFVLPSTVVGIGLIALWNRPTLGAVYGTAWLVLVGYVAQYTAVTSRATVAGLSAIPRAAEEAARLAGAGWFRRVALIVAPLASRSLCAAWIVAYLLCVRDTGLTMMIYPPGGDTLPVRTFTLMANGAPPLIAALCVMMIAAAVIPLGVIGLVFGDLRPGRQRAKAAW